MSRLALHVIPLVTLATAVCAAAPASTTDRARIAPVQDRILATVDEAEVYRAQPFFYRVTVNDIKDSARPELLELPDVRVERAGSNPFSTPADGQRDRVRGRQFIFRLTALRAGSLTIPGPANRVDGKLLTGPPVEITVLEPPATRVARLELSAEPASVYPMQPFTLQLDVFVLALPKPFADRDPMRQHGTPELAIPWFSDKPLADGLTATRTREQALAAIAQRDRVGFRIPRTAYRDLIPFGYLPVGERLQETDDAGVSRTYWRYRFHRQILPHRSGVYRFDPATLSGEFASGNQDGPMFATVFAATDQLSVEVRPLPQSSRPASWIGAIGRFNVAADVTPESAAVGEPLTLNIEVTGRGTLADAFPPDLENLPAISESFRVYRATSAGDDGVRRFTWALRPRHDRVTEIPSIEVSWFDPDAEAWVTRATPRLPLTVIGTELLPTDEIVSAGPAGTEPANTRPDAPAPAAIGDDQEQPQAWRAGLTIFVTLVALIAVGVLVRLRTARRGATGGELHEGDTVEPVVRELEQSIADLRRDQARALTRFRKALTDLIRDERKLRHTTALTTTEIVSYLRELLPDARLVDDVEAILSQEEAARFGGGSVHLSDDGTETIMTDLVRSLRSARQSA